ncbi:(Fe-S)-binding protein [Halobacillus karajensis]|uniref:Lactate utilization protein A n=1 Tax=Halobacillus karajensis TaxID=195088 RepID=A0A059NVP0_9BACI|nr:(Fe-S)-binding protein [Halobacillus karajensis]CDQ18464.1 Lactate utilization protein A [Halobacillus karajensis]CDQ23464.1 Lactate utilization protein A [Halobacillus karajensis]CDQ26946.1 Lactate utilization protein A [Halobacillus karajensis]
MKVSLFITCLGDVFYPGVGKDVVELLERYGCEIDFPGEQTCCGQPAYNSGYHKDTKKTAKHMIQTFEHAEYVVTPSGSCAVMFKEYPSLLKDEPRWKQRAEELSAKTYELTQFLYRVLKVNDTEASLQARATYHTSCHMTRLLGETEAPYELLSNVRGLQLKELPNKQNCCGFGGTFAVKMTPISEQMVDEKVEHIEETEAEILIGSDNGCLMNIGGRIDRLNKPVKVMHIAQVLNSREA